MNEILNQLDSPLFYGMDPGDRGAVLGCIGYHLGSYPKGAVIALEGENLKHVGVILSGSVDMVKEDLWGSKTIVMRMREKELFGETFACGSDSLAVVTFIASEDAQILFLPFNRVMHSCTMACAFHHRLIENMITVIADKNRNLMHKVEIMSKRTIREKVLSYLSTQAQVQASRYFELPLGRVELAEYLCVDRSALTRELAKMKEDGLIDFDRNRFRML